MKYDVVIVGAGIPGLYCARELCKLGSNVLVIDRNRNIGGSNYSTAGVPKNVLSIFSLPIESIRSNITNYYYATSKSEILVKGNDIQAYVLDFKKIKKLLSDEVTKEGGEVKWGVSYEDIVRDNKKVIGIKTSIGIIEADYYIDASGVESKLTKDAKIFNYKGKFWNGVEYIVEAEKDQLDKFKNSIGLFFDISLAPFGYAWVFHYGGNKFKIGLCEYNIDPKRQLPSLNIRLEKFIDFIGRNKIRTFLERHGGAKILTTLPRTVFKDNVISIGDSICAINPYCAEGIKQGLYSAKFVVDAISENNLKIYRNKWLRYNGIKRKMSEISTWFLYRNPSQRLFELFIRVIRDLKLTTSDLSNIGFNYEFVLAIKKRFVITFKDYLFFPNQVVID
jgi:flavin-dependent dehydrogenase